MEQVIVIGGTGVQAVEHCFKNSLPPDCLWPVVPYIYLITSSESIKYSTHLPNAVSCMYSKYIVQAVMYSYKYIVCTVHCTSFLKHRLGYDYKHI